STPGLPSGLQEFADAVYGFEHGCGAAMGITAAINPPAPWIAPAAPPSGQCEPPHPAISTPVGRDRVTRLQWNLDLRRPGPNVVGERQGALPFSRRFRTAEVLEDRPGIGVGKRRGRNLGKLCGFLRRRALVLRKRRNGSDAGRGRITSELEHVA